MLAIRVLLAFAILLGLTALQAPANGATGGWMLSCFRDGQMAGRAFEMCRGRVVLDAGALSFDRNAQGLVGIVEGCKTQAKGIFRLSARTLAALPSRAARFDAAVATALRQCGLPAPAADPEAIETLLRNSDGLSPDWIG